MVTSLCPQSAAISPEPVKADHSIQSLCEAWRKEPRAERSNGPGDHVPRKRPGVGRPEPTHASFNNNSTKTLPESR